MADTFKKDVPFGEEAEKEVSKEDPKKQTSNYIMRAETGDKQVKIKDRVEE